jgi:hypothetical protein
MIKTSKIFLASSSELKDDRKEFEIYIYRKNKDWVRRGVFIDLIVWEDFLDQLSPTRLQDEYDKEISSSDIFVMLFWTKVGKYTEEEFNTAFGAFKVDNRPAIFTYFKKEQSSVDASKQDDLMSLWAFQKKLITLGHFQTVYTSVEDLKLQFGQQLDKLAAKGFFGTEFEASDFTANYNNANANKFEACMPFNFKAEGGYSDNPADPSGPINFGITLATLKAYKGDPGLTAEDVKTLTPAIATEIYRTEYWNKMQCGSLPDGLDLEVFDFGVNAGPAEAVKMLQKVVGVIADGSMGPLTLAAVGERRPKDVISQYSQARLAFYKGLNHPEFEPGWTMRVNLIQAAALKMLGASQVA